MGKGKRLRLVDDKPRVLRSVLAIMTEDPKHKDQIQVEVTGLPGNYEQAFSVLAAITRVGLRPFQREERETMRVTKVNTEKAE